VDGQKAQLKGKKMELYIIRHGDPYYPTDSLTEKGVWEAKLLAKRMKELRPDKIYTSPLGRAKQTASYTCEALGIEPTVEDWTAESMDYMRYLDRNDEECLKKSYSFSFTDGVTNYEDFAHEERRTFLDTMRKNSDDFLARHGYGRSGALYSILEPNDERIAVFCHGGFGGAWCSHLLSLPAEMGWVVLTLATTSVSKFSFENHDSGRTVPRCIYLNDCSHLPDVR